MKRSLVLILVAVAAVGLWLLSRTEGREFEVPAVAAATSGQDAVPVAAVSPAATEGAGVEVTSSRVAAADESTQRTFPEDGLWLDVRVVDAATRSPVAGALVRWSLGMAWQQLQSLTQDERQRYSRDRELLAERFGWQTRTNAEGLAHLVTDERGAEVFAWSEGRFATGHVGGRREEPEGGWQLELEPDRTLRAQVLDVAGSPVVGTHVTIRMIQEDGKPVSGSGWIQDEQTAAPDGVAVFLHIQNWLRRGGGRPQFDVATWRAATFFPGGDDPGVEFDPQAPPLEPIVLRLPGTGRLAARLTLGGRPLVDGVTFFAYRGAADDTDQWNRAPRVPVDEQGWAHFPHVALGGTLTVIAGQGPADVVGEVAAPVANGQEVRCELRAEDIFSLTGLLLGPDGKPLAEQTVATDFQAEIMSGNGQVTTDAHGRFLWLLTKGYREKPTLRKLVFSQHTDEGVLRVSVEPRELTRGVNDLGTLRLTSGPLVVAGRFVSEPPGEHDGVRFAVERLRGRRTRSGEELWERVEKLTFAFRPDGTFEARGETTPGRHRLSFQGQRHLPLAPLGFRVGTDDLVVPVTLGYRLTAKVLCREDMPVQRIRGHLCPADEEQAAESPFGRIFDRYTARPFDRSADGVRLDWWGLPGGSYTLEIRASGLGTPPVAIPDVALPQPEGGDPRLAAIDLRDAVRTVKLRIELPESGERARQPVRVFPQPQADPEEWAGIEVWRQDEVELLLPAGPAELLVAGGGCRPQRVTCAGAEASVRLEAWPVVELRLVDLPALPAGVTLGVSAISVEGQADRGRRYGTDNSSGPLASLLHPAGHSAPVENGRARVEVGDGAFSLSCYLRVAGNGRGRSLRSVTPRVIQGGTGLAPIDVQLSAAEIEEAIAALQGDGK